MKLFRVVLTIVKQVTVEIENAEEKTFEEIYEEACDKAHVLPGLIIDTDATVYPIDE